MKKVESGFWVLAFLAFTAFPVFSAEPGKKPPIDLFEHFEKMPAAGLEHVARGVYRIGKVQVDQVKGVVTFPARMNAPTWADIEYVAVAERGKDHESLVVVEAEPFHVNLALILAGLTGGEPLARQGDPRAPKGSPVRVSVEWTADGQSRTVPAEELLWDRESNKAMAPMTWVYTGSRFDGEGRFLSQISRSVMAAYRDPDALIDNPHAGGADPHRYGPNEKVLPPEGTPLTFRVERVEVKKEGGKKPPAPKKGGK